MFILSIDTTTDSGGVALSLDAEVLGLILLKTPLLYSDNLIQMVDFLLRQHRMEMKSVDCLGVATGPGSFTGVRVGLATAKAFGQALGIPAVGVSTLEALAWRFRGFHPRIAPMIDARRAQIYGAAYETGGEGIKALTAERAAAAAQWAKSLPGQDYLFVGTGAGLYKTEVLAAAPGSRVLKTDNRLLDQLCEIGFLRFSSGLAQPVDRLRANYVRPSDAELKKGSISNPWPATD
ncbi:MAG: tRNA (adenosine(37)-N6)-threonylcarbamoyltransferase complex dimerization subunit type 1 TsaB [Acidobacteriota bacterium]